MKQYDLIDYSDGISAQEAVTIAQKEFSEIPYNRGPYDVLKAAAVTHAQTAQYPNFWFVDLPAKDKKSPQRFLSVIDKRTGAVIRSADWYVQKNPDLSWIFN